MLLRLIGRSSMVTPSPLFLNSLLLGKGKKGAGGFGFAMPALAITTLVSVAFRDVNRHPKDFS